MYDKINTTDRKDILSDTNKSLFGNDFGEQTAVRLSPDEIRDMNLRRNPKGRWTYTKRGGTDGQTFDQDFELPTGLDIDFSDDGSALLVRNSDPADAYGLVSSAKQSWLS